MNKSLKKAWEITSTVLVVLVVACAVFLMGSRIIGCRVFTVISGSMEPTYSVGDLIYVKSEKPQNIKVGDPITFVLNEDLVVATHRVVRIDAENQHFYTKGDANEIEDSSPVHFNNVVGVPVFSIPYLGYVSDYIQNPPGMYIAIAAGAVLVILVFVPDMLDKKKVDSGAQNSVDKEGDGEPAAPEKLDAVEQQEEKQ
ncbi:MAG: signal peptidase I [Clostridia bacterium]|nr:signal peptidase I [Clostridia bacterium]